MDQNEKVQFINDILNLTVAEPSMLMRKKGLNIVMNKIKNRLPLKIYKFRECKDIDIKTFEDGNILLQTPSSWDDCLDFTVNLDVDIEYKSYKNDYLLNKSSMDISKIKMIRKSDKPNTESTSLGKCSKLKFLNIILDIIIKDIEFNLKNKNRFKFINLENKTYDRFVDSSKYVNDKYRRQVCACSFTESYKNRPLWEIYTNKYEGFAIEYTLIKESYTKKEMKYLVDISPIIYSEKAKFSFQDFPKIKSVDDQIVFSKALVNQVLTKSEEYSYEKEWRLIK